MTTFLLTDDYAKRHMAQAVPGAYWSSEHKHFCIDDPTPRTAAVALRMFPAAALDYPELADERDKLSQDVRPFDNATPYGKRISAELSEQFLANLEEQ